MKKLIGMIALAAISLGSVYAYGNPATVKTAMQQDTTKKKVKQKGDKMKKKTKMKKDTMKKDTMKM
jgi:pentapeptide MXKDX repeat protein